MATKATTAVFGVPHAATSTVFNGDSTDTLPPAGGTASRSVVDGRGRVSALWQYQGSTITAAKDVTTYTVNNKDQLVGLTNAEANSWSWAYDLVGNKVSSTDPDKGASSAVFDLAGQQTASTDARGKRVNVTYDSLGRKTLEADGAGIKLGSWTYDTVLGGKGQLASASSFVGAAEYRELLRRDVSPDPDHDDIGRWMGRSELKQMQGTGRVVEGGGGRTFVTRPPNPDAYPAGKGVFAEFDVPSKFLFPASKPEYGVIPGPNAGTSRFGPLPSEMPPATCISVTCAR